MQDGEGGGGREGGGRVLRTEGGDCMSMSCNVFSITPNARGISPSVCLIIGSINLLPRYVNGHAKKHSEMNPGHSLCMDQGLMVYW